MNIDNHDRILKECFQFLSSNNIATDGPMGEVIRYFFSTDKHVSQEDMVTFANNNGLQISTDDINKTLNLLVEYGFACKKYFANDLVLYEHLHLGEHHDHMYCMKCGKIIEFFSPAIEELQLSEANLYGFHAFSHKMQIKGLCGDCFGTVSRTLIPLSMVQIGGKFEVMQTGAGKQASKRLIDLGLIKGCEGEVIRNGGGGIIINMHGNRIALGKGQGMKVLVTLKN